MKAIVQDRYGPVDVLEFRDIEEPVVGEDDVLVRVRAAGCGPDVWHLMTGQPYFARLVLGFRRPKVGVRGRDLAGTVQAVGSSVEGFRPGDEVMGIAEGSFAELAVASPGKLVLKPARLTFEQAAAVPISGLTALQAIRDEARVQPGQSVLVIGAAGGVGTHTVQVAKAFGAVVTGVCSTSKVDLVRSIGADEVIDYTHEAFADGSRRWDVIVDTAGRRPLVVDNGGRLDEACVGDLVALEAQAAGLEGLVIWGLHRDTADIQAIGLPVFSLGAIPTGPQRLDVRPQDALESATVGDWTVGREDLVLGDDDGVLFVPAARAVDVFTLAETIRDTERRQAERIRAGVSLRSQVRFDTYLAQRQQTPSLTFRDHLRAVGGAIEE